MSGDVDSLEAIDSAIRTYVVLVLTFSTVARVVERRVGARWLPVTWAVAVLIVCLIAFLSWQRIPAPGQASAPIAALLASSLISLGVPLAISALFVWLLGQRSARRRAAVVQWSAATIAFVLAVPLGIVVSIVVEVVLG
jgi:hypothetical protein